MNCVLVIGKPCLAGKPLKQLRVAAFAPAVPSSIDYDLRVYFVEDTSDALEVSSISRNSLSLEVCSGPFKCYVTLFLEILPPTHPPPRNANNIEPYTYVTLFPEDLTTPHPSALRNT